MRLKQALASQPINRRIKHMNVIVEIELNNKPDFSDRSDMFSAAENLTNDANNIHVYNLHSRKNCLFAEFTIGKTPQSKVVDNIAKEFKKIMRNHVDLIIKFPIQVVDAAKPSNKDYTKRQGQYLSFIYNYLKLNKQAPAESDFQKFFGVSPPSVHSMILKLGEKGFISRTPNSARSIKLLIDRSDIPELE